MERATSKRRAGGAEVTRRGALSRLGLGAGVAVGAALSGCRRGWSAPEADPTSRSQVKPYVPGAEDYATFEERWVSSSCAQCPAACGVRVRIVEGRAVRIEGNPQNPLNRGGIGARGLSSLQGLYDADRLHGPMRRVGGRLVAIGWDEALALVGTALAEVRTRAPEELLVISGQDRGFVHELLARFARAFGTPNFIDGAPAHAGPLAQAMEACLGAYEAPAYSWGHATSILTLEAGLLEDSCRSIYFARVAATLRRDAGQRARLIHAGPSFDLSAYNADRWLRVRPGTAGALALGVCHVLLERGTFDADLVERARGVASFRALTAGFTPARVAEITGVAPEAVVELARDLWEHQPAFAVVDERSLAFSNGLETARAALALNALLGAVENPAGGLRLPPAPPFRAWPELELDDVARHGLEAARLDGAGGAHFPAARAVLDALPDAISATPPAVALLYHANPVYARPQPQRWREALARIPMVVSFSPYLDETVDTVADVVLPDHTFLERFEDAAPAPGLPRAVAGVRVPAVAPLHDTRAAGDVILDLGRGLGEPMSRALPWRSARAAIEERLLGLHDAGRGSVVAASPQAFLDAVYRAGFWAEADEAPSRPIEFVFPATWSPPRWQGDPAAYPFVLLAYRPLGYAEGSGANQPWLRTLRSRPGVADWTLVASVHPGDAPPGVSEGELVRVESASGAVTLPVHLDRRLAPGCVMIPTGGGHQAFGRWAKGFGVNVMELLAPAPAPDTGASLLCATRVRITRARRG